jgi:hypothetical protein
MQKLQDLCKVSSAAVVWQGQLVPKVRGPLALAEPVDADLLPFLRRRDMMLWCSLSVCY